MARLTVARVKSYIAQAKFFGVVIIEMAIAVALVGSPVAAQQGNQAPAYTYNSSPTQIPGLSPKKKAWYSKVGDTWSKGWRATTGVFKKSGSKDRQPAKNDPVHLSGKQPQANADLHAGMAQVFLEQGRNDLAAKHFQQALQLEPNNLKAIRGHSRFLQIQGKSVEAEQQIRRAIQLDPNAPGAWNDLGMCLSQQGKRPEAVKALERAIQMRPKKPLYRNNIAAVLIEMGATDKALQHLSQVHGQAKAHYNVGYVLAKTGKRQAAAAHFNRALQLDSSMVAARQWLNQLSGRPNAELVAQRTVNVRRPTTTPAARPAMQPRQPRVTVSPGGDRSAADRFWGQSAGTQNASAPSVSSQFPAQPAVPSNRAPRQYAQPQHTQPQPRTSPIRVAPAPASASPNTPNSADQFWGRPREKPVNQNFDTGAAFAPPQPRVASRVKSTPPSQAFAEPQSAPVRSLPSQQFQPYQVGSAPKPGPRPSYVSDPRYAPKPSNKYKSPLNFGRPSSSYTSP